MLSEGQTHPLTQIDLESQVKVKAGPQKEDDEAQRCDFCGRELPVVKSNLAASERRKYCSKSCQSRASQGRIRARLAAPPSKRYAARLKFSNPLYFN